MDMARHHHEGPLQLGEIAKRQDISVKYLEQIIIPLKKAQYITSLRGRKGGHMLNKPPTEISVGEIVAVLEKTTTLVDCSNHTDLCESSSTCPVRQLWQEAIQAMFDKLHAVSLADLVRMLDVLENRNLEAIKER
jgi:Rrf2 family protein